MGEVVEQAGGVYWEHKRTGSLCSSLRCKALGFMNNWTNSRDPCWAATSAEWEPGASEGVVALGQGGGWRVLLLL